MNPSIKKRICHLLIANGVNAYDLKTTSKQWLPPYCVEWTHPVTKQRIRSYAKETYNSPRSKD